MPKTSIPATAEGMPKIAATIIHTIRGFVSRCHAAAAAFRVDPEKGVLTRLERDIFETHYRAATACDILQHIIRNPDADGGVRLDEEDVEGLLTFIRRVRQATCHLVNRCGSPAETRGKP